MTSDFKVEHPNGATLLARDNPENRKLWGNDFPFGYADVDPNVCSEDGQCPHYSYTLDTTPDGESKAPIHILVAAYRDRLCSRTLHNIFTKSQNPERIYVRVIDQTQPDSDLVDDAGCWNRYCEVYNPNCKEFQDHVQIVPVDSARAKGPTDARSKLSAMVQWDYKQRNSPNDLDFHPVQVDDFCMQIDSHMDFADNFDTGLVQMFHRTENDYAVLSTYVADIEQNNKNPNTVPNLCMVVFTSSIRNHATKECKFLQKPKLTNGMWGAGLSFHRCHAELNVPVDPYLDGVFDGEEGSRGLRFFTHGYDVYTPDKVLVTHDYHGHQSNPVVHSWRAKGQHLVNTSWRWFQKIEEWRPNLQIFGTRRVNLLLGIGFSEDNLSQQDADELRIIRSSRYGLGNKRTLEQAVEFSGIDLKAKRMNENKCGNLKWVPYEESSGYGVNEILSRGYAGEAVVDMAGAAVVKPADIINQVNPQERLIDLHPSSIADAPPYSSNGWLGPTSFVLLGLLCAFRIYRGDTKRKDVKHTN